VKRLRQALATGCVLGAIWGGLEAGIFLLRPWFAFWLALGDMPPLDGADLAAVVVLGAGHYALLGALLCGGATAVLGVLRGRRRKVAGAGAPPGASGEAGDGAADAGHDLSAPRLMVASIVFVNLYWHTKQLWAFSWGLPFHHPKRIALTVAWIIVGALVARVLVRPGGLLRVPSRFVTRLTVVVLALACGWALQRESQLTGPRVTPAAGSPNVLFVVVDALRADRLGCYGYDFRDPPVSPNVDALADEGVVFETSWAQAPFTWTSFGSFLTGKYPREHGLIKMWPDQKLDAQQNVTLAQALNDAGYATGAFLTGTLSNDTGLLHGFDTYFETIVGHEAVNRHSKWSVVRSRMLIWILYNKVRQALDPRLVNTEAKGWIREHADRPFFALVHYYSTHTPYDPPPPYDRQDSPDYDGYFHPFRQKHGQWIMRQQQEGVCEHDGLPLWTCDHFDPVVDVDHVNALYDGGVRFADEMFGDLLALLEELGVADDTLVIFTSDHGEELFDHGLWEHDWMFETNLQIPIVMRLPGKAHAGARVSWPVESRDLPATVLDVAGLSGLPGRSLVPDAAGVDPGPDERHVFAENVRYVSMRNGRYKITQNRFAELSADGGLQTRVFDLAADPGEHTPIDPSDPAHAAALADLLARWKAYDDAMPDVEQRPSGGINTQLAKTLAELGYTAGMSEEAQAAAVAGSASVQELLGDTQLMGSNEMLEEDLYSRPFQWPKGFNGRPPHANVDEDVPRPPETSDDP